MTIHDASYAALAAAFGCPAITTDRRFVAACEEVGIRAFMVDDKELSRILDVLEESGDSHR